MKRYVASMVVVSFAALTVGIGGALAQAREQPACDRFAFDRDRCAGNANGSDSRIGTGSTTGATSATRSDSVSTDRTSESRFPSASPPMSEEKVQQDDKDRGQTK